MQRNYTFINTFEFPWHIWLVCNFPDYRRKIPNDINSQIGCIHNHSLSWRIKIPNILSITFTEIDDEGKATISIPFTKYGTFHGKNVPKNSTHFYHHQLCPQLPRPSFMLIPQDSHVTLSWRRLRHTRKS